MKDFTIVEHLEDLDPESKYLVHKAKEAIPNAYAPYSRFHVGAALLLEDGTYLSGSNQENAAFPSGMCAERVALYAAAALHPEMKITKIAIAARKKGGKDLLPVSSCGSCRQVMLEVEHRQHAPIEVILYDENHHWVKSSSAAALLPFAFNRETLEHADKK